MPFHGTHQAGILTPAQAHGHLVAFDLVPGAGPQTGRGPAAALVGRGTRMMAGKPPSAAYDDRDRLDAGPSSADRHLRLRPHLLRPHRASPHRLPHALAPLPDFPADALDTKRCNGDLWVQIGADDALVAFHALRALQKDGRGHGAACAGR